MTDLSSVHSQIEIIKTGRKTISFMLSRYNIDELNKIPHGFSNNIIWNAAHLLSVTQSLVYSLSGNKWREDKSIVKGYAPGTFPQSNVDETFVALVQGRLIQSIDKIEEDLEKGIFNEITPYVTRTRAELKNIEDILSFLIFHEGIHTGYIMSIDKQLKK